MYILHRGLCYKDGTHGAPKICVAIILSLMGVVKLMVVEIISTSVQSHNGLCAAANMSAILRNVSVTIIRMNFTHLLFSSLVFFHISWFRSGLNCDEPLLALTPALISVNIPKKKNNASLPHHTKVTRCALLLIQPSLAKQVCEL